MWYSTVQLATSDGLFHLWQGNISRWDMESARLFHCFCWMSWRVRSFVWPSCDRCAEQIRLHDRRKSHWRDLKRPTAGNELLFFLIRWRREFLSRRSQARVPYRSVIKLISSSLASDLFRENPSTFSSTKSLLIFHLEKERKSTPAGVPDECVAIDSLICLD